MEDSNLWHLVEYSSFLEFIDMCILTADLLQTRQATAAK
jgi:hypothetical protein